MLANHRHRRVCLHHFHKVARFVAPFHQAATTDITESIVLPLHIRTQDGSRAARKLRKKGYLPGLLYGEGMNGDDTKVLVSLEKKLFDRLHRKLWTSIDNQVFKVQVKDQPPILAIMRDVQFHPVTDIPLTVNFIRYKNGRKVSIPITYINEEGSPGIKRGGYINHIYHEVECYINTEQVPKTLEIDVNGLDVDSKFFLETISFPDGVVPVVPAGTLLANLKGRRILTLPEAAEDEEEEVEEVIQKNDDDKIDIWNDIF
uniref:50S ribosomal protein L25 putative n=1 Tax=Albugo laibachii Nc14 TaxID=890382 RepID=F0WKB2_9STRA|nr:50S ribosomal protein L25 putative [Albugo laibachii Nc14]CCA21859.1 50S ribosomal protein L25 putative [Albugo laibachii Nc14]|eukprot:CCA21859.1 50S ribosomal protein L25 putative [Albugo laibachii Nc14]